MRLRNGAWKWMPRESTRGCPNLGSRTAASFPPTKLTLENSAARTNRMAAIRTRRFTEAGSPGLEKHSILAPGRRGCQTWPGARSAARTRGSALRIGAGKPGENQQVHPPLLPGPFAHGPHAARIVGKTGGGIGLRRLEVGKEERGGR